MKRALDESILPLSRAILSAFYRDFFTHAVTTVIYELGTLGGAFQLFQREIAPRFDKDGGCYHLRFNVYRTSGEALSFVDEHF